MKTGFRPVLLGTILITSALCGCVSEELPPPQPPVTPETAPKKAGKNKTSVKPVKTVKSVKPETKTSVSSIPVQNSYSVKPESSQSFQKVMPIPPPSSGDGNVWCSLIKPTEKHAGFLSKNSFVTTWYLIGPFKIDRKKLSDKKINESIHITLLDDEKVPSPEKHKWNLLKFTDSDSIGKIDLNQAFNSPGEYSAVYAVTYIYSEKPGNHFILYAGSDDFIKIWINGQLVHTFNRILRGAAWDQDKVTGIKLNAGYNLIVVKVVNVERGWNFFFRLADHDGVPLQFLPRIVPGYTNEKMVDRLSRQLHL